VLHAVISDGAGGTRVSWPSKIAWVSTWNLKIRSGGDRIYVRWAVDDRVGLDVESQDPIGG
jgi:hypothetical protein